MTIHVAFTDATQADIGSVFSCAQDPNVWSNLGIVDASDARWLAYYEALPEPMRTTLPKPSGD